MTQPPKCPVCKKSEARMHKVYGVMPCFGCRNTRQANSLPGSQIEFTSDNIRTQRKQFAKSILQPFRDGVPSQEFADVFPDKAAKMFDGFGKPQRVWDDQPNINNLENTE